MSMGQGGSRLSGATWRESGVGLHIWLGKRSLGSMRDIVSSSGFAWWAEWVSLWGLDEWEVVPWCMATLRNAVMIGNFVLGWNGKSKRSPSWVREAPCACVMKFALLGPLRTDCACNCCGQSRCDGQDSTYRVFSICSVKSSLCRWGIWYVTVPIPSTSQPPPIPCNVMEQLEWISVMKSSRCGEIDIEASEWLGWLVFLNQN